MNSRLKRKVYRGIVYTEDQVRNLSKKLSTTLRSKIYRGVSFVEAAKEDVKTKRQLMWRGVNYEG